jgi:hypothetical protein
MAFKLNDNVLGNSTDVTAITTVAPGNANLPGNVYEPQIGEIRSGFDSTLGWAEFIYLKIPASTTLAIGNLVTWTAGFAAAILPVLATSKNTLSPIAVTMATVASSSSVQYGWFQISGQATVLKTAVAVTPNVVLYASGTTGRVKVLTSAGGQILGMRSVNAATVTSTTSSVTVILNRPMMQGQIT